jgi:hypothetical protein
MKEEILIAEIKPSSDHSYVQIKLAKLGTEGGVQD